MGMMEKVKVDRVWCDEIFYRNHEKLGVEFQGPEGTDLGENPVISGEATTAVLECDLRFEDNMVFADVEVMVQEELIVEPDSDSEPFELEYAFRFFLRDLQFQKCQLENADIERLKCQIFRLESDVQINNIAVNPNDPSMGTFDNIVRLKLKIKVAEEVQTFVVLGMAPSVVTRSINNG